MKIGEGWKGTTVLAQWKRILIYAGLLQSTAVSCHGGEEGQQRKTRTGFFSCECNCWKTAEVMRRAHGFPISTLAAVRLSPSTALWQTQPSDGPAELTYRRLRCPQIDIEMTITTQVSRLTIGLANLS